MSTHTFNRTLGFISVLFERYVLPVIFFYRAWFHWRLILESSGNEHQLVVNFPLLEIFRQITWSQLYVITGIMLLIGRRVTVPPQSMKDLFIPLIATCFSLVYEIIPWLPVPLTRSLYAPAWQNAGASTGLALNLLGFCIAIWAALSLGRSFGLFIEVRKVVTQGAYRWVRHPIYFGYLFMLSGFAVANCNLAFFSLLPVHIALLVYRARLEEKRLAASSAEYRDYQKRTGFIFPKLFPPRQPLKTND